MRNVALTAALVVLMVLTAWAHASEYVFPADSGVVNVKADCGAAGDGKTDDTAAIRKAIKLGIEKTGRYASPAFVYFPKGTYLISDTLAGKVEEFGWSDGWRAGMIFMGQSRTESIIRLKDKAEGFGDPKAPKAMLVCGSESDARTKAEDKRLDGGGNRAFRNSFINLTIDSGSGNPGVAALDYVANNRGCVEEVTIRSGDGGGYCGLRLERHWPGPAMVKDVEIVGYDYGIKVNHYQYSMTFEHITLKGQKVAGVCNAQNVLCFRDLKSVNSAPAVLANTSEHSMIVLVDGELRGGAADGAAIVSKGNLMARNVTVEGYGKAIDDQRKDNKDAAAGKIDLYYSDFRTLDDAQPKTLNLPIVDTPTFNSTKADDWVSVTAFGATPAQQKKDDDDTDGIQKAIDSGKPIVYLPNGTYSISKTLVIRGNVRKIMGMQSGIGLPKGSTLPTFRFEGCGSDSVVLEHLSLGGGGIEHACGKALSLRHIDTGGYYNTKEGTGKVFFEDTMGKPIRVLHPQDFWGRQVNGEFGEAPLIENHGGNMWILGFKTEGQMTCIKTTGGQTELLGALLYPLRDCTADVPAFIIEGGKVSMTWRMNGAKDYPVTVSQKVGDQVKTLSPKQVGPGRGPALFVGGSGKPARDTAPAAK
jgi:hypothetical protein